MHRLKRKPASGARRAGVLVVAALAALVAAGCGGGSGGAGGGKTFTLGVEAPLTGPDAESGQAILNVTKMAFAEVGNKVGGYTIKLVPVDDKADPSAAVSAYTYAITGKKVQAMFGNWNTDVTLAVMDVSERYRIPHFFYGALGQAVDDKVHKSGGSLKYFMGKQYPPPGVQQVGYVQALEQAAQDGLRLPVGKTVALFGEDTDFGRGVVSTLQENFQRQGWQVKDKQFFPIDETNHQAMLNTFKREKVSVVAGTGTALQGMANLIKQARNINLPALIIADGLSYTGDWYQATKSASNGVLDLNAEFATPAAKTFEAAYKKRFHSTPSPFSAGITYDYAKFLIKLMKDTVAKQGELTSEALRKEGEQQLKTGRIAYDGMMMKEYRFTPKSWPNPESGPDLYTVPVVQYENGEGKIVYPPATAQAKITIPGGS